MFYKCLCLQNILQNPRKIQNPSINLVAIKLVQCIVVHKDSAVKMHRQNQLASMTTWHMLYSIFTSNKCSRENANSTVSKFRTPN